MKDSLIMDKKLEKHPFPRISRPLVAACISVLLYIVIIAPVKFQSYNLKPIFLGMISPGFEVIGIFVLMLLLGLGVALPIAAGYIVISLASCIPPAIIGWLLGSYKDSKRFIGFILLLLYVIFSSLIGLILSLGASTN